MLSQGTDTDANGASAASPPTDPELEAARKAERERRAVKVSSISHGMIKHHAQDMGLGSAEDPWQWCAACRQLCVPKVSSLTAQCVHPYSCTCIAMHIHGHIHRAELARGKRSKLRRAREKYAHQDEEDRQLALEVLAPAGAHPAHVLALFYCMSSRHA